MLDNEFQDWLQDLPADFIQKLYGIWLYNQLVNPLEIETLVIVDEIPAKPLQITEKDIRDLHKELHYYGLSRLKKGKS